MERLTTRDIDGTPILLHDKGYAALLDRLAAYEDTGLEPEEVNDLKALEVMQVLDKDRAREIAKAEAEGRLVVLPCKVGDTVWRHDYDEYGINSIDKGTVYAVSINEKTNWFSARYISGLRYDYTWDDLGKTVFLTREEAEAALTKERDM